VSVSQTLRRGTRNGITELSHHVICNATEGATYIPRAAITLRVGPHSRFCEFVCVSVTPSTKSTNSGWRYLVQASSGGDEISQLDRGGLAKIAKGVNNVTLFSYTIWPTAMKFGVVRGIGA